MGMDAHIEQGMVKGPGGNTTMVGAGEVRGATLVAVLLARRWVVPTVVALRDGPRRRFQIGAAMPGVSAKVLTDTLRYLELEGIVERRLVRDVGTVGAGYALTGRGRALDELIHALASWWSAHDPVRSPGETATG